MKIAILSGIAVVALLGATSSTSWTEPQDDDTVMKQKLQHSHGLLEGVTTADFDKIDEHTGELIALVESDRWKRKNTPEYLLFSQDFLASVRALQRASAERSVDRASLAYVRMTTHCFDCHKYVRDSK